MNKKLATTGLVAAALLAGLHQSSYALGRHKGDTQSWITEIKDDHTVQITDPTNGKHFDVKLPGGIPGTNPNPVPEPVSALLLGTGLLGMAGYRKLRGQKKPE